MKETKAWLSSVADNYMIKCLNELQKESPNLALAEQHLKHSNSFSYHLQIIKNSETNGKG